MGKTAIASDRGIAPSVGYDSPERFASYYCQVDEIISIDPDRILEIGIGNKTVANYLRQYGYRVTTCDLNRRIRPSVVADVRSLPFTAVSFDMVLAAEILEHIPWRTVRGVIEQLHAITRRHVVVTIPYSSIYLEHTLSVRAPVLKKRVLRTVIRIPYFFRGMAFTGEHYWEMGRRGYSKKVVRSVFKGLFNIEKEMTVPGNPYHYLFVLQKR